MVGNIEEAYQLIKDLEPSSPQEYILKAVANAFIGQEQGSVSPYIVLGIYLSLSLPSLQPENVKLAQQYYQLVGSSGSECGENTREATSCHIIHIPLYILQTPSQGDRLWPPASSYSGSLRTS